MFALIFDGVVVEVADKPFEVSKSYYWVETSESIKRDYLYADDKFTAPEIPEIKKEQPDNVQCLIDAIAKTILGIMTKDDFKKEYDILKVYLNITNEDKIA